jgi:hypothetical protein
MCPVPLVPRHMRVFRRNIEYYPIPCERLNTLDLVLHRPPLQFSVGECFEKREAGRGKTAYARDEAESVSTLFSRI